MPSEAILAITTGGTIGALPYNDPQNPPEFSSMPTNDADFVRNELETAYPSLNIRCISLEPRDSKLIDETYRNNIVAILETAPEKAVLITHGTDTILQTADFLYRQFTTHPLLREKVLILTGAMTPLANGPEADGYLNLAVSLRQLTRLTPPPSVSVVLCDFDDGGAWKPRLYPYTPGKWEKL